MMSLPGCHSVRSGIVLTLLSGFVVCAAGQRGGEPKRFDAQSAAKGQRIYQHYCAVCHGPDGTGKGALATELRKPPADLTRLAAQDGGVFPLEAVARAIDGRGTNRAHGTPDMPVWGEVFARTSGTGAPSTESAVRASRTTSGRSSGCRPTEGVGMGQGHRPLKAARRQEEGCSGHDTEQQRWELVPYQPDHGE